MTKVAKNNSILNSALVRCYYIMRKKILFSFIIGTLFSFCSCIDTTYDWTNKEVSTGIDKWSLPLGSLKPFLIDSLVSGIELIDTTESGIYCIKNCDELCVEKTIHPIELKIPSLSIDKKSNLLIENDVHTRDIFSITSDTFNIEKKISFNNQITKQFSRIFSCSFKKEMSILIHIKFDGLDAIKANAADLELTLDFPPFFNSLKSDDANITTEGTRIQIAKEYITQNDQGLNIRLYCPGFNFEKENQTGLKPQTDAYGATYLSHQSTISANGQIRLRNDAPLALNESNAQIGMNIDFTFDDISVETVNGVFYEDFYKVDSIFAVDLGDMAAMLKETNSHIKLAAPYVELLLLSNDINIPIKKIEFCMFGKDTEGELITNTAINIDIPIEDLKGNTLPDTAKYLLTSSEDLQINGYKNIQTPNLAMWLEQIPDSVGYSVHPILDASKRTNVRLSQTISLNAKYNAVVPLSFEKLHLAYSDTIPVDIDGLFETLGNAKIKLKMTVSNTLPLGLSLKTTALGKDEKPIEEITFSTINIEPCNEEHSTIRTTKNKKRVEIVMESKNPNLADLRYLHFETDVYTNDSNIIGIRRAQGILLSDIAIEISENKF